MSAQHLLKTLCNQAIVEAELEGKDLVVSGYGDSKRASGEITVEVEGEAKIYKIEIKEAQAG